MASDDTSGAKPAGPVALRIKLRYDDIDAMISRFAGNVGRSGLFLPTRSLHPVGTEVKFELRIANDTPVLVGLGRVKAARPPDPANARATFGLSIELMRVTRDGREVIIRMLERRRELGLPDVAIPLPEDVEAARRMDVETQPGVPVPTRPVESAPVAAPPAPAAPATPVAAEATPTQPRATSEIVPVRPTPPPDSLLTAPRAITGPIGVVRGTSDRASAPILAPEPPRAKRPKLADLVAKAAELSGPVAALDVGGESDVDVAKAIARARMLAGGQLDVDLDALRESTAAPVAIDVEAASAELARQLGGKAISKKDRSARWAPPPAVAPAPEPAPEPAPSPPAPVIVSPPNAETIIAKPFEPLPDLDPATEREAHGRRLPTASGEMDELAQEAAMAIVGQAGAGVRAIERADEPLVAADAAPVPFLEVPSAPVEQAEPTPVAEARVSFVAEPVVTTVDEDPELLSFERALDAARIHTGVSAPAPAPDPEDDIEELDADELEDEVGEHTQVGEIGAFAQGLEEPPPPATYDPFAHEHPSQAADFREEEISDLDVLAEADAGDDDLLSANGERDSSAYPVVPEPGYVEPQLTPPPEEPAYPEPAYPQQYEPQPDAPSYQDQPHYYDPDAPRYAREDYVHDVFTPPPSLPPEPAPFRALSPRDDFAARLALDEEDEPARHPADAHRATSDSDDDNDFDEPHNYTLAEDPDYENPELEFDERHSFGRRGFELAEETPDPIEDLDNALSTLDVDLDRLEVPPADRRRAPVRARALPGMPPERARRVSDAQPPQKQSTQPLPRANVRPRRPDSDDGVIIDFDDDD